MSRFLGIDYGSKRVGLALSDESKTLAFPKTILPNDPNLFSAIKKICAEENIEAAVVGESLDKGGKPNPIMKEINKFREKFSKEINLPIYSEPEIWTSAEARRISVKARPSPKGIRPSLDRRPVDASAAALILQRFLEKKKFDEAH